MNSPPSFLGSLTNLESFDNTPIIGTTFPNKSVQLSQLLSASNSDELIKDLSTLISHRGVVFFSEQDLSIEQQKELGTRLGELSGKPESSKLHTHPISEATPELSADISVITSKGGISKPEASFNHTRSSRGWHSDITFENVPSDYAHHAPQLMKFHKILKMHILPDVGGDTLWASGYEAYDRLSPAFAKFLEGLTAVHHAEIFIDYAQRHGLTMHDNRGSPENTGTHLTAIQFTKRIVELSPEESDDVLHYLQQHISENHDLQVRYRWKTNDVAIWDNRATLHTATHDFGDQLRQGNRVVSIGERPYFDPNSKSRRAVLGNTRQVVPDL
ncbi:hypothetical protein DXG01_011461 [Tephrocybe rancida]|nr:hypothetical protein DXG01_011461 [Tephrocybe rancida]